MPNGDGIQVGSKPEVYTGTDPAEIRKNEEAMHEYWNAVQAAQAEFQERVQAESTMQKNNHDAMMGVISNMK